MSSALVIREKTQMCMHSAFLSLSRIQHLISMMLDLVALSLSSVLCLPVSISLYVSLCCTMARLLSKRKEKEGAMDNIGSDLLSTCLALSFSLLFAHPLPCPLNSVCSHIMSNMSIKKGSEGLNGSRKENVHLRMWFSFCIVYRTITRVISQAQEDTGIDIFGPYSPHCYLFGYASYFE